MKQRKWTPERKPLIVLEGLRGPSIGELGKEQGISQARYYQWREQFLGNAHRVFETASAD